MTYTPPTYYEIKEYQKTVGVSVFEAKRDLTLCNLTDAAHEATSFDDLKSIIIGMLEYERAKFGI